VRDHLLLHLTGKKKLMRSDMEEKGAEGGLSVSSPMKILGSRERKGKSR